MTQRFGKLSHVWFRGHMYAPFGSSRAVVLSLLGLRWQPHAATA